MSDGPDHWVFGYGSLIWRVDFPWRERRVATLAGWARRFWQGSHDHRGTPEAPGRVLTLVPAAGETCLGMAYRIEHDVFEHLDHREKNGYERVDAPLVFEGGEKTIGTVYLAAEGNDAWLGPADEAAIAAHVLAASGPSGRNVDYVLHLRDALAELGVREAHLEAIAEAVLNQAGGDPRGGTSV